MDAKEAREKASLVFNNKNDECYTKVKKKIDEMVKGGKFVLTYFDGISTEVQKKLESEGYELHYSQSGMMDYDWIIKW